MSNEKRHLKGLNDKQIEAAIHMDGPMLIVAGAGAGKTKTITHRIVNLIKEGIAQESILAVTFTNKAAREMRERILDQIQKNAMSRLNLDMGKSISDSVPFVSTFHSLGVYIIKENAKTLGLTKYFTILDESDSTALIKETMKELDIDPKQYEPKKIKNIISREKGKFTHLEDYTESNSANSLSRIVAQVWNLYEKKKMKENSLDFDDLLLKTVKLLHGNREIRKKYQNKWKYIHIDEYQDTNEVQYLMSKLLSENNKNIVVVGDADQNIYSWRGANLKNILNFEKDYPEAKIVLLEENYRSTKNILEAANIVIKKNKYRPDKNLFTKNATGEKISLYEALDEADEADFVATKILEIVDGSINTFSEIAVLYRANFQSRVLEEAMLKYNIPYQVLGIKFFERREIKDTLAYLRAALNPQSLSDIKRIINFPPRGIGKVTLAKIFAGNMESLPIKMRLKIDSFYKMLEEIKEKIQTTQTSQLIKFVVKHSGIEEALRSGTEDDMERLQNIKELATLALKYDNLPAQAGLPNGAGIEKLLEDASLASDQDSITVNEERGEKRSRNGVKLMTVHAGKGLEFKYVFIVGLEDGLFPASSKAMMGKTQDDRDEEEERRLFYVAMTRAKEKLFLSFANFRTIFGAREMNAPSEFISDIPADIIEIEGERDRIKTIYLE